VGGHRVLLERDWRNNVEADQCGYRQSDCYGDQVNIDAALCGIRGCHQVLDSAGVQSELEECRRGKNKTHAGLVSADTWVPEILKLYLYWFSLGKGESDAAATGAHTTWTTGANRDVLRSHCV
jgi:hypothetical protein